MSAGWLGGRKVVAGSSLILAPGELTQLCCWPIAQIQVILSVGFIQMLSTMPFLHSNNYEEINN